MSHEDDIRRLFPHASASLLAANAAGAGPVAEPQRLARDAALGQGEGEKTHSARVHLRIVSVRKRLLDPDNLVPKWTIDALRYCGIIRGDEPDKITLETAQRRCEKGEAEHTLIEIYGPEEGEINPP